jgi:hypothetical protein
MEAYGELGHLLWVTGPWRKKFFVSKERRQNHSEHFEGVEPPSHILGQAVGHINADGSYPGDRDSFLSAFVYTIPNNEFCELVYALPDFEDLPLFWNAWQASGAPDHGIVVLNIQDGDTIAIQSEGYNYARYRAACTKLIPVV